MKNLEQYTYLSLDKNSFLYYLITETPIEEKDYESFMWLFKCESYVLLSCFIKSHMLGMKVYKFNKLNFKKLGEFKKELEEIENKLKTFNKI